MKHKVYEGPGVWIPRDVLKIFTATESIVLMEIDSLDQTNRGCYATNEHLADFAGVSEEWIKKLLAKFQAAGWITREGPPRKRSIFSHVHERLGEVEVVRHSTGTPVPASMGTPVPAYGYSSTPRDTIEIPKKGVARYARVDSGVQQTRRNLKNLFSDLYRQSMGGAPPWAAKENAILKALTEQWMNGSRETMEGRLAGAIKAFFDGSNDGVARFTSTAGYELGVFKSQVGKLMATEFVCPKCKGRDYKLFAGDRECGTCV